MRIGQDEIVIREQLRELQSQVSTLRNSRTEPEATETIPEVIPSLVNFADNGDFVFSDEAYSVNATTYLLYTDDEDVLAHWYGRAQATATAWVENASATESTESIRSSAHTSTARTGFEWNTTEGSILLTGGYRLGTRIHMKHANAGNYMVARCQVSRVSGAAVPTSTVKLKASLWDNTNNGSGSVGILRGSKPPVDATRIGTVGAVRRDYILEVVMPDGRAFYSDTVTFTNGANRIDDSVATTSIDSENYVTIAWDDITGASRYRLYRRTPSEADTNWYLIETITNGGVIAYDYGGTGGGVWTIPTFDNDHLEYQLAQGFYDDIGELLVTEKVQEVSIGIRVPYNFSPNGNQFLQLEFVKEDYTATTTTEIPADGIRIDRVGLSYTNGRWAASARDMAIMAAAIVVDPPPSGGGDGDNPPDGGGITCVVEDTPILVWDDLGNHHYMPANQLVMGDKLVAWDIKEQAFAPTIIKKVIKGISITNYILHTESNELQCSFSHRLIRDIEDFTFGTSVKNIEDSTLVYKEGKLEEGTIIAKEILSNKRNVVTFNLSNHLRNYIAGGFLCHNLKAPIE